MKFSMFTAEKNYVYILNGQDLHLFRLFITPVRCGILADQSLMLRRRRNDHDKSSFIIDDAASTVDDLDDHKADDIVPQIYACATMWHETRFEMTQLLKSIFRYIHV